MVGRNIAANFLGAALVAALALVATPLQVNILGVRAYGLVGFIATLQVLVTMLDFGLSATLTRELAADGSEGRTASLPLLRTAAAAYYAAAVAIGIGLAAGSGAIARRWFHADPGWVAEIRRGLVVIAIFLAVRWPVSLCAGVLSGLQRLDLLNLARVAANVLRSLGGIAVLLVWRTLDAFLIWTALSAVIELAIYVAACRFAFPAFDFRPRLDGSALRPIWRDMVSMGVLALIGAWLPQLDKLMISRMLPVEQLGYYSIGYNAVTATSLVITAILTAVYPALSQAHGRNDRALLQQRFEMSARVMIFATGLVLLPLMVFGRPILALWVNPAAASRAWAPMALLAAGFWLNASAASANSASAACRRPDIPVKVNLVFAPLYLIGLYMGVSRFGLVGAASAWVGLNLGYVLVMTPWAFRSVLHTSFAAWMAQTFAPFTLGGVASFLLPRLLVAAHGAPSRPAVIAALGVGELLYLLLGWALVGREARSRTLSMVGQVHARLAPALRP